MTLLIGPSMLMAHFSEKEELTCYQLLGPIKVINFSEQLNPLWAIRLSLYHSSGVVETLYTLTEITYIISFRRLVILPLIITTKIVNAANFHQIQEIIKHLIDFFNLKIIPDYLAFK